MDFKNCKILNNSEIELYKKTLENEFESTKFKIDELCKYLEKLDKEFEKANIELKIRKNINR